MRNVILISVLALFVVGFSCNTLTDLQLAVQDIPVLAQEAQKIEGLVDPLSPDILLTQKISAAAVAGLQIIENALNAYQAAPSATTLQKLADAMDQVAAGLPQMLQGLTFVSANDALIVTSAVAAISTTLDILAANLPGVETSTARALRLSALGAKPAIPSPAKLRHNWNTGVCSLSPNHCPRF